jgi:hypothetical protein
MSNLQQTVVVTGAIFALAQKPAGERPLRTPVPNEGGVVAINDAVAPVQREFVESLGFSELLPRAAALVA